MQISLTHNSETEVKIVVVAAESELQPLKEHVLNHFRSSVKLPGFRQGKAPLPLVEKSVDQSQLQAEFLNEAINQMYVQAVNEKRLRVVANPEVSITKFVPFTTLEFEATVQAVGELKLPDYKKMKMAKPEIKITADDVKSVIESLQTRLAEKKDVDRAVKAGDQVWIDFKGMDDKGEPVKGADGKDYPLVIGSDTFIPGFEDNVIGMNAGEEKTFTLKFPKDYGVKALANKDVTFTVIATKVQEIVTPKVDDDFAAKAGPFKTVQELKDDIKTQLASEREYEADQKFENELILAVGNKTKVAIPQALIDDQVSRIEEEEKRNLMYRGQTWQEHLEEEGVTEEEHHEQKRPQAEERVRASLALAEIAEAENITVTPEELEIRIQLLKGQYQDAKMQGELEKPENRRDIASRMLTEKTIEKLKTYVLGTKE
jgi:trigger factor